MKFACHGNGVVTNVTFASVGTPSGSCYEKLVPGACQGDLETATKYVRRACVGKHSCSVDADINTFNSGKDPCYGVAKSAAAVLECSTASPPPPSPPLPGATVPKQWQVNALKQAVACGLRPIVRLGQHNRNYRYFADDRTFHVQKPGPAVRRLCWGGRCVADCGPGEQRA